MTDNEDRSGWARKFISEDDIEELEWKSDRFIAFENTTISMRTDLNVNEAITLCKKWDKALDGDNNEKAMFLNIMSGAIDYLVQCLEDLDIDYSGEFIDDEEEQDDL